MNKIDLWHLCDELSVPDTSLLILGLNPEDYSRLIDNSVSEQPEGYKAVSTALKNAILSEALTATVHHHEDSFGLGRPVAWEATKVKVEDLKRWLLEKNFTNNFFFQKDTNAGASYLDPENEFYAPKLSAAVNAWLEVTSNPKLLNGKTPKQALDIWLRQNANDYGLTKEDGNPNQSAIEEISKIANWKLEGGAAKTPTQVKPKATKGSNKPTPEIPF